MTMIELFAANLAVTGAAMVLLWLASLALRDASIVDVFWGFGFALIAGLTFFLNGAGGGRQGIILGITCAWGLRLTLYLGWRKFGAPEDYRYRSMREWIGPRFGLFSLVLVFALQWLIMNVVALPIMTGAFERSSLGALDALGCGIWAIGLTFESIGDLQLARFKANPGNRGKVMDRGLWRYTRHPNYFGDFLIWWGIYLVSFGEGGAWWTVVSPLLMSVLLLRVSGVALLERSMQKKEGYSEYMARTSAFFPWPPRKGIWPR